MMILILGLLLIALIFIWIEKRQLAMYTFGIYLIISIVIVINDMTTKLTLEL